MTHLRHHSFAFSNDVGCSAVKSTAQNNFMGCSQVTVCCLMNCKASGLALVIGRRRWLQILLFTVRVKLLVMRRRRWEGLAVALKP